MRDLSEGLVRISSMLKSMDKKAGDFGTGELLNPFEIHLIAAIGGGAGQTVTELADWFFVTKGAISQVVGKLARAGYIDRERNPQNGKEILLTLTGKGDVARIGHEEFHRELNLELLEEFGDVNLTEMKKMKNLLLRLSRRLERSRILEVRGG